MAIGPKHAPKHAMVLAAGLGTRMRPLTDDRPKAMVEVAGRPLIDYTLDGLRAVGVEHVVVNLHYKADVLEKHLATRTDMDIILSDERGVLLDTGGGVVKALPHFGDAPFYTHNCDTLWLDQDQSNLERLAQNWDPAEMDALMLLASSKGSLGYDGAGDFFMGAQGCLSRRGTKARAPYVWAGVQIIKPALFEGAPEGAFSTNLVLDKAIAASRLYGLVLQGTWMHVGTPEAVIEAGAVIKAAHKVR